MVYQIKTGHIVQNGGPKIICGYFHQYDAKTGAATTSAVRVN